MLYEVDFHLTLIQSRNKFNAKPAIDKLSETSLGVIKVNEIHISNRSAIDTYDGVRVKRDNFNKYTQEGFYACDSKIILSEF